MQNKLLTLINKEFVFIGGDLHGKIIDVREAASLDPNKYTLLQKYFNDKQFKIKIAFIVDKEFDINAFDSDNEFSQYLNSYSMKLFQLKRKDAINEIVDEHILDNFKSPDMIPNVM